MTSWSDTLPELRTGTWTRLGSPSVLGDAVTEELMGELAASTRAAAQAQGYAVGWAQGRREAAAAAVEEQEHVRAVARAEEERREAEHRTALAALAAATEAGHAAYEALAEQLLTRAADAAATLTEALVGRVVAQEPAEVAVRRALAALAVLGAPGTDGTVRVRVRPDAAAGAETLGALAAAGATVVPDPSLAPGDAVVETDDAVVDARLDAALARVLDALAGPAGGTA